MPLTAEKLPEKVAKPTFKSLKMKVVTWLSRRVRGDRTAFIILAHGSGVKRLLEYNHSNKHTMADLGAMSQHAEIQGRRL